ncbi:MAG TPA: ketopantoate reductase C-terminal domain-containing protein, partial [Myxococcales bacterium]|nr:ketopantoate reductase C-terminal domain-containing protein [Myxococcales bacterium]
DGGGRAPKALLLRPLRRALVFLASRARPRQRSGMLERLLAGRTSGQVDDLNGAVVAAARARGLLVPLNEKLLALVHAIERGEERIGPHQLERL